MPEKYMNLFIRCTALTWMQLQSADNTSQASFAIGVAILYITVLLDFSSIWLKPILH